MKAETAAAVRTATSLAMAVSRAMGEWRRRSAVLAGSMAARLPPRLAARILGAGLLCCKPPVVHAWHDWTIDLEQIPPEDRLLESQWASLPLVAAHALPLPDGDLCVAETTIHRMRLVTSEGSHLRKIGSYRGRGPLEWYHPSSLAEAHGMLYVTDSGNGRVQKINITDGNDTVVGFADRCGHELDKLNFPTGLALLEDRLFVSDYGSHRVVAFDASVALGRDLSIPFLFEMGRKGIASDAEGEFNHPRGLAEHANELIVADVMNHRLQVFSRDGSFVRIIGREGDDVGHFKKPIAVASFGGRLFVAEYEGRRLQVLETDGTPVQVFAPKEWGELLSVYVSAAAVLVSDERMNTVHVLSFTAKRRAAAADEVQRKLEPVAPGYSIPAKRDEL